MFVSQACRVVAGAVALALGAARMAAAQDDQPQVWTVVGPPPEAIAGMPLQPTVRVRVRGAAAGILVRAYFQPAFARAADGDTATTDAGGIAQFPRLTVWGPVGKATLTFSAGPQSSTPIPITIRAGLPRRVVILSQPYSTADVETLTVSRSVVRVVDAANNPIEGARIVVSPSTERVLAEQRDTVERRRRVSDLVLIGPTSAVTNAEGEASFDTLRLLGPRGLYALAYSVTMPGMESDVVGNSELLYHDPDHNSNQSFVVVSAIKSIAGVRPDDEFFDVRFRYRYGKWLFGLASIDIALTGKGDSVRSSQRFLTEASASLNLQATPNGYARRIERSLFVGATGVVFNTLPYAGFQLGSVEHASSAFAGSSFVLAGLFRLSQDTNFVGTDTLVAAPFSVYGSFFLRSSTIAFFKTLNIRGGVLLPFDLSAKRGRLTTRLVVAIPVGSINFF